MQKDHIPEGSMPMALMRNFQTMYRLQGNICPGCETKILPPRDICPNCGGDTRKRVSFDGGGV